MAHVFASYLAEAVPPTSIEGAYDPEQELWIGNNQALAAVKNPGSDHGGTTQKTCNVTVFATATIFPPFDGDWHFDCTDDTQSD